MTPTPNQSKELVVTIKADGETKINAENMPGSEAQILAELAEISEFLSGDPSALKVEAHKHGKAHVHVNASGTQVHTH